jgi:hypothetical protein
LEQVILQALAKKPAERFDSAESFGAAYFAAVKTLSAEARMAKYWV